MVFSFGTILGSRQPFFVFFGAVLGFRPFGVVYFMLSGAWLLLGGAGTWKQHKKVYMKTMGKQTCMSACENIQFLFIVVLRVEGLRFRV